MKHAAEFYEISDDVTEIPEGAFAQNKDLKSIDLRNVRYIGDRAFQECTNLESVKMSKAAVIGHGAFEFCRSLRSITLGDVREIGSAAFLNCSLLDIPEFPRTIRSVGNAAFSHTAVRRADLHWLPEIPPYLFSCCTALTYADISGAREIGEDAFSGCRSLSRVKYDAAEKICARAFYNCDLFEVTRLPAGLQYIGDDAVSNVRDGLVVPKGVTHIGKDCLGPADRKKKICLYESALYEFRNYFLDDYRDSVEEEEHFYLWESSIDVTVLDDMTDEVTGYLPLFSDLDKNLRSALTDAFRADNSFDYTILDTTLFDGMRWNQRCRDKMAVMRSKYPYGLTESARVKYYDYLARHLDRIAKRAVRDRDIDMLSLLNDIGLIGQDNILGILDCSIEMSAPECTAFLLELRSEMKGHSAPLIDEL